MSETKIDEHKLEVLLHEHLVVNKKIDDFINVQFTYITTLITMSAGFIYFALSRQDNSVMTNAIKFLPYLVIILGPTFLFKFNRAVILHGYRTYIEDKINENFNCDLIYGGKLVLDKLLDTNPFARFNYLVLGILFLVTIFVCNGIKNLEEFLTIESWCNLSGHFYAQISILLLGISFFIARNKRAYKSGYEFSKKIECQKEK